MAHVTVEVPDDIAVRILEEALTSTSRAEPRTSRPSSADNNGAPPPEAPPDDPWDSPRSAASGGSRDAPASGPGPSRTNSVVTDSKGRTWTFGAPNAPDCQCGEPAVQVKGETNGRAWSQWRCAKDYDDYKNKCQFAQFVGGK